MKDSKKIWLSYSLNQNTPLYGNRRENFKIHKTSSMANGDSANDTKIETTVHVGTHIDLPYHFYINGQTVEDFDVNFWFFSKPLFIDLKPDSFLIQDELISLLDNIHDISYDILIIKTGICNFRDKEVYWKENYGFDPNIYSYLKENFPSIRVIGFDSISMSSWQHRDIGKISHKAFLNPQDPILILEDMDLNFVNTETSIKEIIISPLRIDDCDGLPCSVFCILDE